MIIGTIFSITPAFVYWLAGYLADPGRPVGADDRRHRRVHDPPVAPLLPARPAAQRPGRDPGRARPVRPDLRVPRDGPRDRRRARCGRARRGRRSRPRPVPRRLVPLPDGGRAGAKPRRGGRRAGGESEPPRTPRPSQPIARAPPFGLERHRLRGRARASSSRSSARRARARRRRPTSSRGCTTSTAGAVEIDGIDVRQADARQPRRRDRLRDPGDVPVPRHDPRRTCSTRSPTRPTPSSRRRPGPRRSTSGSRSCPTATTRSSASAATSCRAARSSGSRSPGSS